MIKLLLVTPDREPFAEFASATTQYDDIQLSWAESGQKALDIASGTPVDLIVVDEKLGDMTGIEFIEKLLSVNPMINCAAVSPLPSEKFHEVSEGLGVLAQLPVRPGAKESEDLLKRLKKLKDLAAAINIGSK